MAHSYAAIYLHVVFATRDRGSFISADRADDLYAFMGGIGKNLGFKVLKCGGTQDHVHLLVSIPARMAAATVVQKLKANSSRFLGSHFAWQEGYGVFAVSASQLHVVKAYIAGQEEHHRKKTFEEEFGALITRSGLRRQDGRVVDAVR